MGIIGSSEDLKREIIILEAKILIAKDALLKEGNCALESINPLAPVKNIIEKIKSYTEGDNVLDTIIGLGTGLIIKKLVHKKPGSIIKNIASVLLQLGFTHTISGNKEAVQRLDKEILNGSSAPTQ